MIQKTLSRCVSLTLISALAVIASPVSAQNTGTSSTAPHNLNLADGQRSTTSMSVSTSLFNRCNVTVNSVFLRRADVGVPVTHSASRVNMAFTGLPNQQCIVSLVNSRGAQFRDRFGRTCTAVIRHNHLGLVTRTKTLTDAFLCALDQPTFGVFVQTTMF
jgi:hypothetical protein